MGEVFDINGNSLTKKARVQPMLEMDTEEGNFSIPVVVLSAGQHQALVAEITAGILEEVLPLLHEQLELPLVIQA